MKYKLRKIGNSLGVLIPKEHLKGYNEGDYIELEVITKGGETQQKVITEPVKEQKVITQTKSFNTQWCSKHDAMKGSCGCK